MNWLTLLIFNGILTFAGLKIYEKYINNTIETPQKPEFWYAKTENNNACRMYIDNHQKSTGGFEDSIIAHEAFVHRHLHNKTAEIECFFFTGTDEHKLVKYTRTDETSDVVEVVSYFERIQRKAMDNCYKHQYYIKFRKLDSGIVERNGFRKCRPDGFTKTVREEKPVYEASWHTFRNPRAPVLIILVVVTYIVAPTFFLVLQIVSKIRRKTRILKKNVMENQNIDPSAEAKVSTAEPKAIPALATADAAPLLDKTSLPGFDAILLETSEGTPDRDNDTPSERTESDSESQSGEGSNNTSLNQFDRDLTEEHSFVHIN